MAIKWDDVKIGCSLLTNTIYLGKVKKDKDGFELWTDKSGDKTQDCVKAVMEHMLGLCEERKSDTATFTIDDICELTITDLRKK